MRVVVVGGGFGGMAVAARLAKLGHEVTAARARAAARRRAGAGRAGRVHLGRRADVHAAARGRARPVPQVRTPGGARARAGRSSTCCASTASPTARRCGCPSARGPRRSRPSTAWDPASGRGGPTTCRRYADDWEVLRREYLERPWDPAHLPGPLADRLRSRETLAKRVRGLKDDRLRMMATHAAVAEGHEPRDVPAWVGVTAYVEQRFGAWTVAGGMAGLADALVARLATRKVEVRTDVEVRDLVLRGGRAVAVVHRRGRGRRGRGRGRLRPPPAAGARAARAADDARPAARRDPPRARGRPPGPRPRDRPARRRQGAADHRAHQRSRVDAAGSWPGRRGPAHDAGEARPRRPRAGRHAGRPLTPRPGRRVGRIAVRRAVAGPADGVPTARPGHTGARACTPRARTPPPAPGCRTSACPPRWWPSSSGLPEPQSSAKVTVTVAAIVVSPGSMATDFIMSRATPPSAHADRSGGTALGHGLDLAEAGSGQLREVTRARHRVGVRAGPGRVQRSGRVAHLEAEPLHLEAVADLRGQRGQEVPGRRDVGAGDAQRVPRLEAARLPLVVVGRPDVEVRGADPRGVGVLAADGDDLGGGRVGARQGLGDAGRAMARGDADDDGVGDLAGGTPPGDGDGAHAAEASRQAVMRSASKISSVARDRLSV